MRTNKTIKFVKNHKVAFAFGAGALTTAFLMSRHYDSTHISLDLVNRMIADAFEIKHGDFTTKDGSYDMFQIYPVYK